MKKREVQNLVTNLVQEEIPKKQFKLDDALHLLGIDLPEFVEIGRKIENELGINCDPLTDAFYSEKISIKKIADYVLGIYFPRISFREILG